jgi:hypothetical protein
MKKVIIAILIAAAGVSGVFAQDNTVTVGAGAGFGIPVVVYMETHASYERHIVPEFSIGVNASFQLYPLAIFAIVFTNEPNTFGYVIDAQAHWYPGGGIFHLDLGGGYAYYLWTMHCAAITSGLGWRFLLGDAFVINAGFRCEVFVPIGENVFEASDRNERLTPFHLGPQISIGAAF